jgi:outer membrane protein
LSHQQSVFQQKVARNTLTQKIQQAYLDVVSAVNKYSAVQEQLISLKENFKMAQIRYDAGALDFFSFHETLNNQTKASSELLQAKYDFLFKRKILDLYLGKTLSF